MGKIRLTPEGLDLMRKGIVRGFIRNPEEVRRATEVMEIDLDNLLGEYLQEYFHLEEDLMNIRTGAKPKHNPLEYYTPKPKQR